MNREILRLAIPNIISNITVPLLGMIDLFIVGHLEHSEYIGAIALANIIFNVIYMGFSFLRMGTSGFTAQAYGAADKNEQATILFRSILVAFSFGLLIIILQSVISGLGFYLLDAGIDVKNFAKEYFSIYIWAAPAVLGLSAMNGWYVGMQNAKIPMYTAIIVNVINIGLSFTFVYNFKMQIKGVALGTAIAQYAGLLLSIIIWFIKYEWVRSYFNLQVLKKWKEYIPFFKVNADIFIRTIALISVTTFFMSRSAKMGDDILAVNALLMQLFLLFSYVMDGFAYAAEALTGRFIGSKAIDTLRFFVKRLFVWGVFLSLTFTLIYALFTDEILNLLTDKPSIISISQRFQFWALLMPIAGFSAFLWDGIFIGATASKQMRNSMLIAVTIFFMISLVFKSSLNNHILWFAFIVYLSLRGIIQAFMASTIFNKHKD
ncbi:MAG: MATE family efflux transporter [Bacteroidales bacterium]|nr:MATE family efflux transporter [Bacteroidales bacterium]